MLKLSRRKLFYGASALMFSRFAFGAPRRLARKDCFFGLHFDLHPTAEDTVLGRDITEKMISNILESCRPDFIQYDSKGHPGYLGFQSKNGQSAPGIVQDSLAMWRRVTARYGVALYNHFSGVLDGLAITKHPDWARVGPDGKADAQETSLFSLYEQELMIPELKEAALNYDLDGSWVDGDCWAVKADYGAAAQRKFREATGIEKLPENLGDPGWSQFLEMQREMFRQYVAKYVDSLHQLRPAYQITSNWMYSTFMPEQPDVSLDYLSGDIADPAPVRRARIEARYFASCGKPWDLMSWGFETDPHFGHMSDKPVAGLEQEAAIVLAQGGAYQIYYGPTRAGWVDASIVKTSAAVGKFSRDRQEISHRSATVPEVGILFSGNTLYRTAGHPFGPWDKEAVPAEGAVDLMLACGYSVDLIPDWLASESVSRYPLIVVPDWKDIGDEMLHVLTRYAGDGGNLMLCGAENARLFSSAFNLQLKGASEKHNYFVADDNGFAEMEGFWQEVEALKTQVIVNAYRTSDTRKDSLALGIRMPFKKGIVAVCPGPLTSAYGFARTPIIRSAARSIAGELHQPAVAISGDFPALEIVLRTKNGYTLLHLINTSGAPVTGEFRHTGEVPPTGPLNIRIKLSKAPTKVVLEPEGISVAGEYKGGEWHGELPNLHIHSVLKISHPA